MLDIKPIILIGKTCSGKTTIAKALEQFGVKRNVTYTSRPRRPGERDGIDYHFVDPSYFDTFRHEFAEIAEYDASFGHCFYGSKISQYERGTVTVLTPKGYESVLKSGVRARAYYIKLPDDILRERAIERGDDLTEIDRRLASDREMFKTFQSDHPEAIVINKFIVNDYTVTDIAKRIIRCEKLVTAVIPDVSQRMEASL